jgi:hypothetical protein
MPGLLRAFGRTAVIAGTATAVSGRVQRRQARRFGAEDVATAAPAAEEAAQEQPAAVPAPRAASSAADTLSELKSLGELKAQGVLTDDEFAAQKAKILSE